MKRYGNLLPKISDIKNVEYADVRARQNKRSKYGINKHDENRQEENISLAKSLADSSYKTSPYTTFKIYEPKERIIFRLPYFPDRIAHHAIMNILEPIWKSVFISNTYSCIKGRGINKCRADVRKTLDRYPDKTIYCLKLDIKKCYPSLKHDVLKRIIRKKIKDKGLLVVLDEIIDSSDGVPIGNYLSQYFANLYFAYFDHWIKEECKVKFYFRYADDIVILHSDKKFLHNLLVAIKFYMHEILKVEIKSNYQIFPVDSRGLDFVGYRFYHTHTLLRKSIKQRLKKSINNYLRGKIGIEELQKTLSSYFGWCKYCDSKHLLYNIELQTGLKFSNWKGKEVNIISICGYPIYFMEKIKYSKYYKLHFVYSHQSYITTTVSKSLLANLEKPKYFIIKSYGKKNKLQRKT